MITELPLDLPAPATSLAELHDRARLSLPIEEWLLLDHLLEVYPEPFTMTALAGYLDGGEAQRFSHLMQALRLRGLVEYPVQGFVRASRRMFPEGLA